MDAKALHSVGCIARVAVLCVYLFWAHAHATAPELVYIRTAAQANTQPKFIEQTQDGTATVSGLCIDIQHAIERVDPGLRFIGDQTVLPAARVESELADGYLDAVCGFSRTGEREQRLLYIEPPLFVVRYHLVARANDTIAISNWDDVRRLGAAGVILVPHGFGPIVRLRKAGGLRIDSGAIDATSNLHKLVAGRGRFFYHRVPGIYADIRKAGVGNSVRVMPTAMEVQPFYMVASKAASAGTVSRLHRALDALSASGELKRLFEKWQSQ